MTNAPAPDPMTAAARFLRTLDPSVRGTTVLVAVSGGLDSMVLLHVLTQLGPRMGIRIVAGHVHHGLRGSDADADLRLVRIAARRWGIPSVFSRVSVRSHPERRRLGLEGTARMLRYRALESMRRGCGASWIATAHHADDQAETVILRASRGADVRGLAGILPRLSSPPVMRPLLAVPRAELMSYAARRKVVFREDSSNSDLSLRRNLVRHRILEKIGVRLGARPEPALNRLADAARRLSASVDRAVAEFIERHHGEPEPGVFTLPITPLRGLPEGLRDSVITEVLRREGIDPERKRVARVWGLAQLQAGRRLEFPSVAREVIRERDALAWVNTSRPLPRSRRVVPGGSVAFGPGRLIAGRPGRVPAAIPASPSEAWVDAERLIGPLVLRRWRASDRFVPLGMPGSTKKLSDILTEQKVPHYRRQRTPILTCRGTVVWVCGIRLDDRFKVTPRTGTALQFSFTSNV